VYRFPAARNVDPYAWGAGAGNARSFNATSPLCGAARPAADEHHAADAEPRATEYLFSGRSNAEGAADLSTQNNPRLTAFDQAVTVSW